MSERQFKGIWIPASLWLDRSISFQEKVMLIEIDSLQDPKRGCYKSNKAFAEFFGLSKSRVSEIISSLAKKKLIRVEQIKKSDQVVERRIFIANSIRNTEGGYSENGDTPIRNTEGGYSENGEERGSGLVIQEEGNTSSVNDAFEKFWSAGMVKTGKKTARAKFEKLVRDRRIDPEEFSCQLVRDVKARLQAGVFGFDRLHPTTYLNQERWEDEIVGDNTATVHRISDYIPNAEEYCSRGPVRGRAIPSGCEQPDDDGILTLPDGTQCRIEDWDAGLIHWDGKRSIAGGRQ